MMSVNQNNQNIVKNWLLMYKIIDVFLYLKLNEKFSVVKILPFIYFLIYQNLHYFSNTFSK